ncbi:MAG: DNA polymerase III subunit delta' [Frankiaceae bacterium]
MTRSAGGVFDEVIGQQRVVAELRSAADAAQAVVAGDPGVGMSHAWLFTGPPGSGRSVAARAFAAALECGSGGCGSCPDCRTALAGTHADVEIVRPEGLSIGVREARELVARAGGTATRGRWRVVLVEDADRLTEGAANVLLKTIEEPPPRTVWLLCVPSAEDLPPTIRSRCRLVRLGIPTADAIAAMLIRRDSAEPAIAAFAARAAQGHVGRARWLARDAQARRRRRDVLLLATELSTVPAAFSAAENLDGAAKEEAAAATVELDSAETAELREALGEIAPGRRLPRGTAGAMRELEGRQKSRGTRTRRDALDRALLDLAALYRDVLVRQLGAAVDAVHGDAADEAGRLAGGPSASPAVTLRRMEAVFAARAAIEANVAPQLALEAMALTLHAG